MAENFILLLVKTLKISHNREIQYPESLYQFRELLSKKPGAL